MKFYELQLPSGARVQLTEEDLEKLTWVGDQFPGAEIIAVWNPEEGWVSAGTPAAIREMERKQAQREREWAKNRWKGKR